MKAAFTLLELMVVLVLIGILAGLILPEMKGTFEDALLRSTARKLASAFGLAYSQAISVNELHRIRLDTKNSTYILERKAQKGETGHGFVPVLNVPDAKGELDQRITVEFHRADEEPAAKSNEPAAPLAEDPTRQTKEEAIAFYPDGTADAAEIILRDREGFRLALRINPTTARVRIVELEHP